MIEKFAAWAIETGLKQRGLIGRYWWFGKTAPQLPIHLEGCRVALFTTRRIARENLPSVRRSFPKARIIHVTVTVKESP